MASALTPSHQCPLWVHQMLRHHIREAIKQRRGIVRSGTGLRVELDGESRLADEVEAFVSDGALEGPNAKLPFNTSGGNIGEAYIHGFELVAEAARQVRGDSTCQVKDVALSLMVAGPGYAPGSAVLFGTS